MLTGVDDDVYQDETDELHGNVAIGDKILNRAHRNVYLVSSIIQYDYTQDPTDLDECCLRLSVLDKWS